MPHFNNRWFYWRLYRLMDSGQIWPAGNIFYQYWRKELPRCLGGDRIGGVYAGDRVDTRGNFRAKEFVEAMRLALNILLNTIVYLAAMYSLSLQEGDSYVRLVIFLIIAGLVISAALTPWYIGNFLQSFLKSVRVGMAVPAVCYLIGYWYPLIKTHIHYS